MPERRRHPARLALVLAAFVLAGPVAALPEAARQPFEQANLAARQGDGIALEAALRKALQAGASREDVAARMGQAYLLQDNPGKAAEWLLPGRFAQADAALGWRMTGRLHYRQGRLAEAGKAFDRGLALTPGDPLLWVDIGRLRCGRGAFRSDCGGRSCAAAGAGQPRAIEFRAQLLRDSGGPVAALSLFQRGLEVAPEDTGLLAGYAAALGEAARAKEMLAVTRQLHTLDPRSPLPLYFQAVLAARAGKIDLARSLLTRLGTRLTDLPAAMLLQGALELEAGNTTMAVEVLERLDRRQGANPRVQALYAAALLANGDHTALRQRFEGLAGRPDAPTYLLTVLGRSYEQTGDRAAAARWLDRAAAATMPPVMPIAGRNPLAAPGYRADSFNGHVLRGDAALARQSPGAAFAEYERAALVRYPEWLMLRGVVALGASGRQPAAIAAAWNYHAGFPDSLIASRLAAGGAGVIGDWSRAAELYRNVDQRAGHRDVRLLADLSLVQLRADEAEAALRSAETAHRLQRASGIAAQARGMALARLKRDRDLAGQLLAKAQKLLGDYPLLRRARADLGKH